MRKAAPKGLSRAEIARKCGVSGTLVSDLALRGIIPVLNNGRIDLKTAQSILKEREEKRQRSPSAPAKSNVSLLEAQRRKEVALAEMRELDLEARAGRLVDAAVVHKRVFEQTRIERDAWMNWPARIGPLLAAQFGAEAHAMTTELERHVRDHLTERATARAVDAAGPVDGGRGVGGGVAAGSAPDGVGMGGCAPIPES